MTIVMAQCTQCTQEVNYEWWKVAPGKTYEPALNRAGRCSFCTPNVAGEQVASTNNGEHDARGE